MSGERGGQSVGPSRPIQRPENIAFRARPTSSDQWGGAPSCWKKTFAAGAPAEERRRAVACPGMSYLCQSSPQNRLMIMLHMTPHRRSLSGCLAHAPWRCAAAVITISERYACLQHQRREKCPRWKTWWLSEIWGLCQLDQTYHWQNCVAVSCPLVSAPAESAQPLLENLMHSYSWHVQFPWSPTNWHPWTTDERHTDVLYLLVGDTLSAPSVPFQDAPSLQKFVVPCFDPLWVWYCFLINTTKLPLHPKMKWI
jgi:hypothetical protein